MACDAETIIANATADGYQSLTNREQFLCIAATLKTATGLNAQQALNSAAASGYYKIEDLDWWIWKGMLASLCPPVTPITPPTNVLSITNVSPNPVSVAAPPGVVDITGTQFPNVIILITFVKSGTPVGGAYAVFISSTHLTITGAQATAFGPGTYTLEYSDANGGTVTYGTPFVVNP